MQDREIEGFRFRSTTRAPYEVEGRFRFDRDGDWMSAWTSDLSLEGMFVRTDEPRPPGTLVEFEFAAREGGRIGGLGTVVWRRSESVDLEKLRGMGVLFRYLDTESRQGIYDIVTAHLESCGKRTDDLPKGSSEAFEAPLSRDESVLAELEGLAGPPDPEPIPEPIPAPSPDSATDAPHPPASDPILLEEVDLPEPSSAPPPPALDEDDGAASWTPERPTVAAEPPPLAAPQPVEPSDSWVVAQEAFKPPGGRPAVARSRLRGSWLWALLALALVAAGVFGYRILEERRRPAPARAAGSAAAPPVLGTDVAPSPGTASRDIDAAGGAPSPELADSALAAAEETAGVDGGPAGGVGVEPGVDAERLPVATRILELVEAQEETGSVIVLALDGRLAAPGAEAVRLTEPPRFLIRLPGIERPAAPLAVSAPQVLRVRAGEHLEDGSRYLHLVFDLASPAVEGALQLDDGDTLVVRFEDV